VRQKKKIRNKSKGVANNSALSLLKPSLDHTASRREIGNSSTIYGGCELESWIACTRFGDYILAKRLQFRLMVATCVDDLVKDL